MIPLADQLKELRRELGMRRGAYPRFVARGALTQAAADKQVARLEAAIETLETLLKQERLL
jgi:hypothetical protein